MKIHLPSYSQALHLIEETLEPEELGLDKVIYKFPVSARLHLDRHDPFLDFKITLNTRLQMECDRCLEPFEFALAAEGPMIFILGNPPRGEEIDDSEIAYVPQGTRDLDITNVLRDLLVLSIPPQCLCRDDCRGLCPNCGANLNNESCGCSETNAAQSID